MSNLPQHVLEILSARKRAIGMGLRHDWVPGLAEHPLAGCVGNHVECIEVELAEDRPDYLSVLVWVLAMARSINAYCDATRVTGDRGAEFWLWLFTQHCDRVCRWEALR